MMETSTPAKGLVPSNMSSLDSLDSMDMEVVNATDQETSTSYLPYVTKVLTLVTIILLAVFSNLLVILSVVLYRKLRGINNYFLVSLALADLLVALFAMTLNATQELSGRWIFGSFVCDLWNSIDVHASTVSTLHLCCISLDRYYAIVRPLEYKTTITTRVALVMMVFAWLVPTLISFIPIFLGWYTTQQHLKEKERNPNECTFVVNKPYAFISSTLTFWCPVIVMLITYQRVYSEAMRQKRTIEKLNSMVTMKHRSSDDQDSPSQGSLHSSTISWKERTTTQESLSNMSSISEKEELNPKSFIREKLKVSGEPNKAENGCISGACEKNRMDSKETENSRNSFGNALVDVRLSIVTSTLAFTEGFRERKRQPFTWRKEHKTFITLGLVLGAFLVCWLPFFTWYLTTTICGEACICPPQVVSVLFWIGYFNSTLNPIIYAMTNQDFKIAFISILKQIFCCRTRSRSSDLFM